MTSHTMTTPQTERELLGIVRTAMAQADRLIAGVEDKDDLAQTKRDLPATLRALEHTLTRPAAPDAVREIIERRKAEATKKTADALGWEMGWCDGILGFCDELERALAAPAVDYPACSGDPASCPENEGRGCCKPNPAAVAAGDSLEVQQRCVYPDCNCPFDHPGTEGWCARGLAKVPPAVDGGDVAQLPCKGCGSPVFEWANETDPKCLDCTATPPADAEQRAKELFAASLRARGYEHGAGAIEEGRAATYDLAALDAIAQALRERPAQVEVAEVICAGESPVFPGKMLYSVRVLPEQKHRLESLGVGAKLYTTPPPAVDVSETLRTLLQERNHRTDGDLQALADRCLHLSRGDKDLIAMRGSLIAELEKERAPAVDVALLRELADRWVEEARQAEADKSFATADARTNLASQLIHVLTQHPATCGQVSP